MLGGRDSYADYSYGYEPYRSSSDPSMYSSPVNNASPSGLFPGVSSQTLHHGSSITEMHRQQGVYFNFAGDFSAGARPPGSPYYYAGHQAALYSQPSHSPMLTPQLPHNAPATLGDKKREMQVIHSFHVPTGKFISCMSSSISNNRSHHRVFFTTLFARRLLHIRRHLVLHSIMGKWCSRALHCMGLDPKVHQCSLRVVEQPAGKGRVILPCAALFLTNSARTKPGNGS